MRKGSKFLRVTLAVGLALSAGWCVAAAPAAAPRVAEPNPAADVATWLLVGMGEGSANAVELAGRLVRLSPAQRAQFAALARELEDEKAAALAELNEVYADKVREALDPAQRARYDGVLAVLAEMEAELTAARTEFGAAAGAASPAELPPRHVPIADAAEFLSLGEPKRAELYRLREALHAAVQDALLGGLDGRDVPADPDAWRERRKQFAEAREKAQADYRAGLEALLSPDEREQLERIEQAADAYNRRLREARRQAAAGLLEVLQARQLPPEPQGEAQQAPDPQAPE